MNALVEPAVSLLKQAKQVHGDALVYPCSMGLEGSVLVDMISKHGLNIPVMTLDTGRLPQATYDVITAFEARYGIRIQVLFPDCHEVEAMVREYGVNLFRKSVELRKQCCEVRKVRPLMRALEGKEAWVTGRRRQQSKGRADLQSVETDSVYGLKKYNPLLEWSLDDVWSYVKENDVPYNRLHDAHYQSIGCECCTRAITVGEDERAGRWWWENDEVAAECGLHVMSIKQVVGEIEDGEGI
ncbi:phosphoadenylylsulfate reductase (thioredoxin) [Mariprofundus ferrinatatus]|uniref:Adenosine 5'-phosphosulfate reductase n=1 Tax=Mariprofundus ferrinatatus TaxID=1921087 RepID=A0A2K8L1S8_9PROT|nr:phosphoadenylyl-sulfate reductase [Mariprofundus ferrinatatus]ATX81280.1 phosphoadenylylsulfate reductase (thioredoxin) [Mariprofundus ferrinatatus]